MSFPLRIRTKNGQKIIRNLTKDSTIQELKLELVSLSDVSIDKLNVLTGYPPKKIDMSQDNVNLANSGISAGDTLILEEMSVDNAAEELDHSKKFHVEDPFECPGILMKQIVPADNSCLFTSINFVLNGTVNETNNAAAIMRQLVAETIRSEKHLYDEAILGKPVEEYCTWIQDNNSWGGAIELSILAKYFGVEIAVIDTINAIINCFGEDQLYPHRVFLLFDGIHYDPLYMEPVDGGKIQTIFPSNDERIYQQAQQLATEAKSSRQYTDVDKFTLKCMVCNIHLQGQIAAQQHAYSTGHANFGEI